jgi:hypothetical protein
MSDGDNGNGEQLLAQLRDARKKAQDLRDDLLAEAKYEDADKVDASIPPLTRQIDRLIAGRMAGWLEEAAADVAAIQAKKAQLDASIREIREGVATAQGIVKAVGYIDDLVRLAAEVTV